MRALHLLTLVIVAELYLILFLPNIGYAADLSCLQKSLGMSITWSSAWQKDQQDDGIVYRILDVEDHSKKQPPYVGLELVGSKEANYQTRFLIVRTKKTAKQICRALKTPKRSAAKNRESKRDYKRARFSQLNFANEEREKQLNERPFIRYTSNGWVRALPDKNQSTVDCRIFGRNFSCASRDYELYGNKLKSAEMKVLLEID